MSCWFRFLAVLVLCADCTYDLDKVYRHAANSDAAAERAGDKLPEHLIELFSSAAFIDDDCQACANKECKRAETSCREDPACVALELCTAERVDPDRLAGCRAEQADWCAEDVLGHSLGGAFYACAFRDKCAEECNIASDWSCLGKFAWEATPDKTVRLRIRFAEAVNGTPAARLTVKVFRSIGDPLTNPASTQTTDEDGLVSLDLPTPLKSFRGYLQIEGDGWYPTLIQFGYPIVRETVASVLIVTEQNVLGSVALTGDKQSDDFGQLQLRMFGCAGVLMRDVSFAADRADQETSRTWYYDGYVPTTDRTTTTTWGNGGIINVHPGVTRVTARLGDMLVASSSAPVMPGFLTIVLLTPLDSSMVD